MIQKIKSWIIKDLFIASVFCVFYLLFYFFGQTCLIKWLFDFSCPACGMTRAVICLLNGDIEGYIGYNYMAVPTFIAIYGCLHTKGKAKRIFDVYACVVGVCVALRYIFYIL
ncbi:MAG: DUF2752 domain-containing protein [Clostridia bacterium]|nr:DUF2752 domain-containing protein [Clostridia bacterium]